jgi:K+-sensing histidine kinase KdpD
MDKKLVLINQNTLEALEEVELGKIIERFVKTGINILSADFGFMFWKLENKEIYQIAYVSPETPYEPKLPRRRGYNNKASKKRIPYFITNPKKDLLPYMKSLVIIPIFYKKHQYGNIVLCFKKKRIFTKEEGPLITTLSNSAAQALTIHKNQKKTEQEHLREIKKKDEFFNIVSHELKSPVTTITGFSQIILNNLKKGQSLDKTQYFLDKICKQSEKLSRLVNDLLDISRIETGKLLFENNKFELEDLITQTLVGLKVAIRSHPISFKSRGKFWVRGDAQRIEAVLINLITNAAKYSPPNSKIKVTLGEKYSHAFVEVEDFGYGIPEKDSEKVFTRFFQSSNSNSTSMPGLGLGLYIANTIVEHHGGMLGFTPKTKSKGTIFHFTLPYYKSKINKKFESKKIISLK